MANKKNLPFELESAKAELLALIDNFIDLSDSDELRPKVQALIPAFHLLRKLGKHIIPGEASASARERILIYLQHYPLTVISSEELLVVAGITDYMRRIRELRVEFGWPILSGKTVKAMAVNEEWDLSTVDVTDIKPSEYIMLNSGQDRDAAHRWNLINSLRKERLPVKEKILKYFRVNVGRQVTGEELAHLAKDASEWGRRARELRTQEGWPVKTRLSGRPDLPVGVYILEEDRQAQVHDRKISDPIRVSVLERDNFSCRKCGWSDSQRMPGDPRHLLELHHLEYHANKGSNTADNLITVCNVDHDEIHRMHMDKLQVFNWIGIKEH